MIPSIAVAVTATTAHIYAGTLYTVSSAAASVEMSDKTCSVYHDHTREYYTSMSFGTNVYNESPVSSKQVGKVHQYNRVLGSMLFDGEKVHQYMGEFVRILGAKTATLI